MSPNEQAIFYFIMLLGCLIEAFLPAAPYRVRPGWLGLASGSFVLFWNALSAR